jgi:hypothetical protein
MEITDIMPRDHVIWTRRQTSPKDFTQDVPCVVSHRIPKTGKVVIKTIDPIGTEILRYVNPKDLRKKDE